MTEIVAPPETRTEPRVEIDNPFVGLRPFTDREANLFFGREKEIRVLVANLRAARLTLLYGPSGVGKSSVLRAGVARELRRRARRNLERRESPELAVVLFDSWRDDPVSALANAVEQEVAALGVPIESRPRGDSLAEVLAGWSDAVQGPILVVLDGFEEYFHYHGDERDVGSFAFDFADAVTRPDLRANFLLSIREDTYAKLDLFTDEIPQLFDNYIRLDHLTVEEARAAIHGPIAEYNRRTQDEQVVVEDELVDAILEQVRPGRLAFADTAAGDVDEGQADRIAAPFLQLVLERLWNEEREQRSNVLRRSTLSELGETKGIVEGHVRRGLEALSAEEQDVAAQAFRFLATRSGTKIAHSAADIADFTGLREGTVEAVLEKLVGAETRILNRLPAPRPREAPSYELYHDLLAEAVLAWRSDRLGAMATRAAKAEARAARRRANRFRAVAGAAVVAAAVCLVLLVVAIRARHTADDARKTARAQELVAESEATLPTDPDGALRKAEQALEVKPSPQAEFAFRTAVGASQLRVAIRHRRGAILRAAYSGDGRRVMALGADRTVSVSDARTGRRISSMGYGVNLRTADLSRDGRLVVTAGRDNTVRFWNATTGARLATFHQPHLSGAWLDPADGRRAVATDFDGGLQIWRLGARKPLDLESPAIDALTYAAFSPDGRRVVAIGRSNDAWVFDTRTGKRLHTLFGHHLATINAVAWSSDSRRIVTGGNDLRWWAWDAATGKAQDGGLESDAVTAVAFSPDGTRVATAAGNHATVWDSRSAEYLSTLQGHSNVITDLAFRRDGRLLLTGSSDGTARVWDVATRTTLTELRGSGSVVESAVFSPNGRFVLTASADRTARIWDVGGGLELWPHTGPVRDAAFSPNGKDVLTGGQDRRIVVSAARTGKSLRTLPAPPTGAVNSIRFSRDRRLLAVASDDPHLLVRRAGTGTPVATLTANDAPVFQAVFSPDSTQIAIADSDGKAGIFDARTGALRRWLHEKGQEPAHPLGSVNGIGWSPDGRFIVTGGSDSQVHVWNARSGRFLGTLWGHVGPVTSVAFAPDANRVVTTGADRTAYVWAIPSGTLVATLRGDPQPLYAAAFNPNGRWIATGDSGGVVRVWDWRAQKMLAAIPAHADLVNAVSFSRDGKRILSASDDGSAKIYPCTSCIPLDELRYRVIKRERLISPL